MRQNFMPMAFSVAGVFMLLKPCVLQEAGLYCMGNGDLLEGPEQPAGG